jgi:hypothetical protein
MNDLEQLMNQLETGTADGPDVMIDPMADLMSQLETPPDKTLMEQAQGIAQPYIDIYNKRMGEAAEAGKRIRSGEESLGAGLYEAMGSGVAGTLLDVGGQAFTDIAPQNVQDALNKAMATLVEAGLDTEEGQWVIQNYDKLSDSTKRKIEATGNFAALLPLLKGVSGGGKVLSKGMKVKRNRLSEALSPYKSETVLEGEALRRFKPDVTHEKMIDTLMDENFTGNYKNLKKLSPNKTPRANIEVLDGVQSQLEAKLMNQLRTKGMTKIPTKTIAQTFDKRIKRFLSENDWLQKDKTIKDNIDLYTQKFFDQISQKGLTPEGLIQARRKFDKMLNDKMFKKGVDEKDLAAHEAFAKVLRRVANDVAHEQAALKGLDIKTSLKRSSAIMSAIENLATKHAKYQNIADTTLKFIKAHPFAASSIVTGGSAYGLGMDPTSAGMLGAMTVGPVAYGAYRYAPQTIKAADVAMRGGLLSTPGLLGYGAPEEMPEDVQP